MFLVLQALRHASALTIQWLGPNTLVYLPLGLVRLIATPQVAGRTTLALLALGWNAAHFVAARRRGIAPENACLASLVIFNFGLYWGFLSFLAGWPFFLLWTVELEREPDRRNRIVLALLACGLYLGHVLWFGMACVWLAVRTATAWTGGAGAWRRASTLIPAAAATLAWYPAFARTRGNGFDLAAHWIHEPLARFAPGALVDGLFGGLRGSIEPLLAGGTAIWLAAALLTNRGSLRKRTDGVLLSGAACLFAMAALAPDQYFNTLFFARRWMPEAAILLILALPRPRAPRLVTAAIPLLMLSALAVRTADAWRHWEREEMSGLVPCLSTLPRGQRLLGLDFVKESAWLKGRPFLQVFAYAQAWNGSDVNFSFAELGSGLVRDASPRRHTWTVGLEWFPERVTVDDIAQFDYLLVNGGPLQHETVLRDPVVSWAAGTGTWRLYRVWRQPEPLRRVELPTAVGASRES